MSKGRRFGIGEEITAGAECEIYFDVGLFS